MAVAADSRRTSSLPSGRLSWGRTRPAQFGPTRTHAATYRDHRKPPSQSGPAPEIHPAVMLLIHIHLLLTHTSG
jgi:hypothetical protein